MRKRRSLCLLLSLSLFFGSAHASESGAKKKRRKPAAAASAVNLQDPNLSDSVGVGGDPSMNSGDPSTFNIIQIQRIPNSAIDKGEKNQATIQTPKASPQKQLNGQ